MSLDDEDIESNARVSSRVTTSLNVRRQADMSAQIVVKLSPGTGLDVTDEVTGGNYQVGNEIYNNWFEVNVEGVIGFAAAFYVDRLSTGPTGPTGPIPEVMSLGEVSTRVQSVLNLREAADTGSASLGKLEPGTRLKIKEKLIGEPYTAGGTSHTDWLEVEVDDKTGFVAAFYGHLEKYNFRKFGA